MDNVLAFLKEHLKVVVTVVVMGVAVTLGYAQGCTVNVGLDSPVTAPASP